MTGRRAIDLMAWSVATGLLARAAAVGGPRLAQLLNPGPADLHERTHAAVACLTWIATMVALAAIARRRDTHATGLVDQLRSSTPAAIGLHLVGLLVLATALAPLLTALRPDHAAYPTGLPPSVGHWFGTTRIGTDVLTDTLYGARVSLLVGGFAVAVSTGLGTAVGAVGGHFGGPLAWALGAITDVLLSIPRIAVLLLVVGLVPLGGARLPSVALLIGLTGWMHVARTVRTSVLSTKELDYVVAARGLGLSEVRILTHHVLPNVLGPVVIHASFGVGAAILTEAALAWLGRGASTGASWGGLVQAGSTNLSSTPWASGIPGLCLMVSVVAFNLVGDGLRDALDPRQRARTS